MSDFAHWMASVVARTESALERALPGESVAPQRLHAAMRYATLGAGKRVRPCSRMLPGRWARHRPRRWTA